MMRSRRSTSTSIAGMVVAALTLLAVLTACRGTASPTVAGAPSDTDHPSEASVARADAATSGTIAEVLRTDERFSHFRSILERTNTPIAESILAVLDWPADRMGDDRDGVTLFVPTDEAFEALDSAVRALIEDPDVDNELLYSLFGHHYVHRLYPASAFEPGDQRTWRLSFSGPVQLGVSPLTWDGHPIIQTDIRATNGIIHVIDGVVVPDLLAQAARRGS